MPRFTEEELNLMCRPASDSEDTKLQNAESILRKALSASSIIDSSKYEIFGQGSYANNTNIRLNSDIDINVCYTDAFYYNVPAGKTGSDYGHDSPVSYSFTAFKNDIERMLVNYYGRSEVVRNNKCITVKGNTNRIQIDVVPTWRFRRYDSETNRNYVEGVVLYADDNQIKQITNFPKQHLKNGVGKNSETYRRFKRLTRIFKNVRVKMENDKYHSNDNISSFLLECLVFNVPTATYNKNKYNCIWNDILKDAIFYIWDNTKEESATYNEWGEVSELLYLMKGHKWTRQDVHDYMYWMWNYLQLK
ncbi:MAG: nucleotidyltransferase domain-containing protein [Phocaeicola sp.]